MLMLRPLYFSLCHFQKAFSRRSFCCLPVLKISVICSFIGDDRDRFQTLNVFGPLLDGTLS
jgi:hypothetical protein